MKDIKPDHAIVKTWNMRKKEKFPITDIPDLIILTSTDYFTLKTRLKISLLQGSVSEPMYYYLINSPISQTSEWASCYQK